MNQATFSCLLAEDSLRIKQAAHPVDNALVAIGLLMLCTSFLSSVMTDLRVADTLRISVLELISKIVITRIPASIA